EDRKKIIAEHEAYQKLQIPSEIMENLPIALDDIIALKMDNQDQFHTVIYLTELLNQAIKEGMKVYENTAAKTVEQANKLIILTDNNQRVKCDYIIQASHYPFYDGQGYLPVRLSSNRSYAIAVETEKDYPGGMYINTETPTRSIRNIK